MTVHNCTVPNWVPLLQAIKQAELPEGVVGEFMWMCEQPRGVHQYKHRLTRRYAHLREGSPAALTAPLTALQIRYARLGDDAPRLCTWCHASAGAHWETDPYGSHLACGKCLAIFRQAAREGVQASLDAHNELWQAEDVYSFIAGLWSDEENAPLPQRMPYWFGREYEGHRTPAALQWVPASVGCHWSTVGDEFCISTYQPGDTSKVYKYPDAGYVLLQRRNEIGRFAALEEAQQAAADIKASETEGVK